MSAFRVIQIDHVELFVPDRHEAAAWYRNVLGLEIVSEYEHWASDPRGPLMISSDSGNTKLALFQGEPQGARPTAGFHLVAFRVDARGFLEFLEQLRRQQITDYRVSDHDESFSVYFSDPYGHQLEVTTYEHEAVRNGLRAG